MRHRRPSDEDEDGEEDDEPDRPRRLPRRPKRRSRDLGPVRRWPGDEDDEEGGQEEEDEENAPPVARGWFGREKEPVYFRARDSVYFEPLVALAIIVVLLAGLFAFTQNWPPMYVVESNSMQHGPTDQLGLINTGDLVLAQKVPWDRIQPYYVGLQSGYSTYGEFGDVILYHPYGQLSGTPIIHRALLYIEFNPDGSANVPALAGQTCGNQVNPVYSVSSTANGCGSSHISGTLTLYHVGWESVSVVVALNSLGRNSGFLTMGDNNFNGANGALGDPDQPALSSLVQPDWIVGVARGMLPWFGAVKLLFEGNSAEVPAASWEWIGVTLVAIIASAVGIHMFLRAEGIEDERRKEDDARRAEELERRGQQPGLHWPHPLRRWRHEEDADQEDEVPERHPRGRRPDRRRSWFGGRPKPQVGRSRSPRHAHHRRVDSEEEL